MRSFPHSHGRCKIRCYHPKPFRILQGEVSQQVTARAGYRAPNPLISDDLFYLLSLSHTGTQIRYKVRDVA